MRAYLDVWTSAWHRSWTLSYWPTVALLLSVLALLLSPIFLVYVFAQTSAPLPSEASLAQVLAHFINTTLVVLAVQAIKTYVVPAVWFRAPALLPILAGAMGPLMALAQARISARLGYPVDLSALTAVFTGASAVAVNQVVKYTAPRDSAVRRLLG